MQIHDLPSESSLNANDYVALDNGTTNRKGLLKSLIESVTSAISSAVTALTTRVGTLETNSVSLALGTEITSGSLNDYRAIGNYYVTSANAANVGDSPYTSSGYTMLVRHNTSSREQILIPLNTGKFYRRRYTGFAFNAWEEYVAAPHFVTQSFSYEYSNLASEGTILITPDSLGATTPAGYTPIGFVTAHSGLRYVDVIWQNAAATGTSTLAVLYNHTTTARSGTARFTILYAKTDLMS